MSLPTTVTSPDPAPEAETLLLDVDAALDFDDALGFFDLNDGEDWGWEP